MFFNADMQHAEKETRGGKRHTCSCYCQQQPTPDAQPSHPSRQDIL